jgi:hypothetical protein
MSANTQTLTSIVAVEVAAGDVNTMPQIARRCASTRQGKPVHPSTPLRWVFLGVKTPDGRRVKLEACRCGGRWVTSSAAFERFLGAQTPVLDADASPARCTSKKSAELVEQELEKLGV